MAQHSYPVSALAIALSTSKCSASMARVCRPQQPQELELRLSPFFFSFLLFSLKQSSTETAMELDMALSAADTTNPRRGVLLLLPKSAEAIKKLEHIQQRSDADFLWQPYQSYVVQADQDDVNEVLDSTPPVKYSYGHQIREQPLVRIFPSNYSPFRNGSNSLDRSARATYASISTKSDTTKTL